MAMDLDIEIEGDSVRFTVIGPIDTEGAPELTVKFMEIIKDDSIKHAVFDLTDVPTITSAGIGKLLTFYKHFDQRGGSMKISGLSDQLRKQFEEIHLNQIIPLS
jgi:anti-anti-sigma factor